MKKLIVISEIESQDMHLYDQKKSWPSKREKQDIVSNRDMLCNPTYKNCIANHYENLKKSNLEERNNSRIAYLRNFNNWIKAELIREY